MSNSRYLEKLEEKQRKNKEQRRQFVKNGLNTSKTGQGLVKTAKNSRRPVKPGHIAKNSNFYPANFKINLILEGQKLKSF